MLPGDIKRITDGPLRELPDEIRSMKDNACSYCGISYLILHEVEEYKQRIRDLERENRNLQNISRGAMDSKSTTLSSMKSLTDFTEALKARADTADRDLDNSTQQNKKLHQILSLHTIIFSRAAQGCQTLLGDIRDIRSQISILAGIRPESSSLLTTVETISNIVKDLAATQRAQLDRLQADKTAVDEELASVTAVLAATKLELLSMKSNEALLQNELTEKNSRLCASDAEYSTLMTNFNEVSGQLRSEKLSGSALMDQRDHLTLQLSESETRQRQLDSSVRVLQENLQRAQAAVSLLEKQLSDQKAIAKDMAAELSAVRAQGSQVHRTLQETIEDKNREIGDLLEQLRRSVAQLTEQKEESLRDKSLATEELRKHKDLAQQANDDAAALRTKLTDVQNTATQSGDAQGKLMKDIQTLYDQLTEAQRKLVGETAAKEQLAKHLVDMRAIHEKEAGKLQQELEKLQQELEEACLSSRARDSRMTDLENKLQMSHQQAILFSDARADIEAKTRTIEELMSRITFLETQLADAVSPKALSDNSGELDALKQKVATLQATIYQECTERNELLRRMNGMRARITELEADSHLADRKVSSSLTSAKSVASLPSGGTLPTIGSRRLNSPLYNRDNLKK